MKRLLPFIILLTVFLGGLIAVPLLLSPERHRKEITDRLSSLFKRPVVVGSLSMTYFPPTLKAGELGILKDGTPVLQIDSVTAPLDWSSLFHLKFVPAELHVDHLKLTILRKLDATWDLDDWFSGISGLPTGKSSSLRLVSWKGGEVHWVDHYASVPQELVLGSIEGNWFPKDAALNSTGVFSGLSSTAHVDFKATGQFFSSPQWSGDVQLSEQSNTVTLHVDDKTGTFDIKGASPKWRLANAVAFLKFYGRGSANTSDSSNPILIDNWQLHAAKNKNTFSFDQTAAISGGLTEIKGNVAPGPAGLLVSVEGGVKDIPAEALACLLGENLNLTGKVTGLITHGEMVLASRPLSTLSGQGSIMVSGGHYQLPEATIKRLSKAKTMAYLKKKYPDLEQNGIPVTLLSTHWDAQAGVVSMEDGLLLSPDMKAGWVGKLDADHQGLDGYVRLQIHEKDPKLASLIPTQYQSQPAFGHLQGTWQEWSLKSVRASKIPTAIQSKLRKAINQK